MPTLNLGALIKALRQRQSNIYNLYVYTNDLGLSDALLRESQCLGQIIDQLQNLLKNKN